MSRFWYNDALKELDARVQALEGGAPPSGGEGAPAAGLPLEGGTLTGPLTVQNAEGEYSKVSAANLFLVRPAMNAACFIRAGEGGDLFYQDQASQTSIQITDLANGTLKLELTAPDGAALSLRITNGGDLWATALSGPNKGKSVNLTYGRWR